MKYPKEVSQEVSLSEVGVGAEQQTVAADGPGLEKETSDLVDQEQAPDPVDDVLEALAERFLPDDTPKARERLRRTAQQLVTDLDATAEGVRQRCAVAAAKWSSAAILSPRSLHSNWDALGMGLSASGPTARSERTASPTRWRPEPTSFPYAWRNFAATIDGPIYEGVPSPAQQAELVAMAREKLSPEDLDDALAFLGYQDDAA